MVDMNLKLDNWKNKLLDLGKRNSMLNFRDTKRSNLRIRIPEINDLWRKVVINETPLEFPVYESELIDSDDQADESFSDDYSTGGIKTNKTFSEQQKTLRNLRNKSKTFIEEQGINALYLSFGFLSWKEEEHSEQYFDAPLILVPVTLTWESITSPYILNRHDDEIVVNPTLSFKLENDYGIVLPDFDEDGSLDLFFSRVESLVSNNTWKVKRETALSMLSFLKINMYNDLEKHRNEIAVNPIIRAIAGDSENISHDISGFDGYDHDKVDPKSVFQIVDADSSQQDAILSAKKGISFVLQGPPGTGKSQTITNIISECLADGKKVLFVAEKMAALDVVYKRLSNANLSDFCLILHSHKANKKDTLAQLGDVLRLASKKVTIRDDIFQQLRKLSDDRKCLDEYAKQLNEKVQPLDMTIYEVNGELAELKDVQDVIFLIPGIKLTDKEKLGDYYSFINKYKTVLEQMDDDIDSNPWKGTSIGFVSNELRHDFGNRAPVFSEKIMYMSDLSDKLAKELHLPGNSSVNRLTNIIGMLEIAQQSPKVPAQWLEGGIADSLINRIPQYSKTKEEILGNLEKLKTLSLKIGELDPQVSFMFDSSKMTQSEAVDKYIKSVEEAFSSDPCYKTWSDLNEFDYLNRLLTTAENNVKNKAKIIEEIDSEFEKDIYSIDHDSIYISFKAESASAFKIFNSKYRDHKKLFTGLRLGAGQKMSDDEIMNVLVSLRKLDDLNNELNGIHDSMYALFHDLYKGEETNFDAIKTHITAYSLLVEYRKKLDLYLAAVTEFEKNDDKIRLLVGERYNGLATDWTSVKDAAYWASTFRKAIGVNYNAYKQFAEETCTRDNSSKIKEYIASLKDGLLQIEPEYNWFKGLFNNDAHFDDMEMHVLYDRVSKCSNSFAALELWVDLMDFWKKGIELGLGDFIKQTVIDHINSKDLLNVFKKRFFRLWLDAVLPSYPAVASFRGKAQDQIIDEFKQLDRLQFEIASARVRARLVSSLPSVNHFTDGVDELSILRRELGKQRRIMPLRKLFGAIPNLIMTLKPCLMMSPLSVSLFLESDCFSFDTVIFDEASQVCTENAIGAIMRGKQVIIAGDKHQLPPTNFFTAALSDGEYDNSDEDDEEYVDDSDAFESVLDEATFLPERTLLWHYRSRHEHLIAYSNATIYHNDLITFPSNVDRVPDLGVEYVYVPEGTYDRGGKRGNIVEAGKVVEMIFEHFRKFPARSLGVITFGVAQQNAIDTILRKKRLEDQRYEEFFAEDRPEPFFIKSIENVQGDERDTIIFSIGYAKDSKGRMYLNFGPLSNAGGERRLNVAITRAKYNVKLVGSILPTDIDLSRVTAEGTKLLRGYIDYAIHGPAVLENAITESETVCFDSPFEESVFNFLDKKGYKIGTQVGCSGYRLDMAIKHPTLDGRYVLGIECDGATYHSARTARERDRLRQDVLESMGWKIYRIWSTDWIKDPVTEGNKLIEAVENALNSYVDIDFKALHTVNDVPQETELLVEEDKEEAEIDNPYGFGEFVPARVSFELYHGAFMLRDAALGVINTEYPVHFERICQLLSYLLEREKATSVVKDAVKKALLTCSSRYIKKGDFYYPCAYTEIPVRKAGIRPIQYISNDEIAAGMMRVLQNCVGVSKEQLINETVRAFGFNRRGANINDAMNTAYNMLIRTDKIKEFAGKVFTSEQVPKYASQAITEQMESAQNKALVKTETKLIYNRPELIVKGARVFHKSFGPGSVSELNNNVICIAFDDGKDRKFLFPENVTKGIIGYIKTVSTPATSNTVLYSEQTVLERKCENCYEYVKSNCGGIGNAKTCTDYRPKVR